MIYFLKHPETGLIKIGKTIDYKVRLSQLIYQYGDLELVGLMSGYTDEETALHERFNHLRSSGLAGREWFEPDGELVKFIDKNASMNFPLPFHGERVDPIDIDIAQVRVAITTKQVINKVAAMVQLETGASVTADLAIRVALEKAFPELAKEVGIDTKKELKNRGSE